MTADALRAEPHRDCPPQWDESDRLAALARYGILDTAREAAFDDIAELAADILDAPIAVVNFIAVDRQWFKAERGIGQDSLPLDVSICRHAILQPCVFVVPDLTKDARFERNPLVDVAGGLRFYAGALLETPDGLPLGTLCVLDTTPRPEGISERRKRALTALASQTMAQLELRLSHVSAREESERLSAMFAQATVGLSEIGLDGRFVTVNDRLCEMLGRTRDEVLTLGIADVTHPDDSAGNLPSFERMVATGESFSLDKRYVRPDGAIVWANSTVTRLLDGRGQPRAALAVTTDITARKAEERHRAFLLDLTDRTRDLAEPQAVVLATVRALGEELGASRVAYVSIDEPRDLAFGSSSWTDGVLTPLPTEMRLSDFDGGILECLRAGSTLRVADVLSDPLTSDSVDALAAIGARAIVSVPLRKEGRLLGNLNVHQSVPRTWTDAEVALIDAVAERTWAAVERTIEQARAEGALRASEARQAFLLSFADALRALKTPAEIAAAAAGHLGERFGLSRVFYAEFFGSLMKVERDFTRGVDSIAGEHDLAAFGPDLLRAYHECPVVKIDDVRTDARLSKDARAGLLARQVGAYLDVVLFEEAQWVGVLALQSATARAWTSAEEGLFRDVGERVRAAIERARAEDRLRELNETLERRVAEASADLDRVWRNASDMFVVIDAEGTFRRLNPATTAILGWTEAEMLGRSVFDFIHPDDVVPTTRALEHAQGDVLPNFENRYRARDGGMRTVSWTAAPEGTLIYAYGRDVTAEKARQAELETAQEALRQSQKMEAMGQLTGGVAHDFNNLLTPIVGSLDMLQRRGLGNEREQRLIAGAAQSAERAKTLVQRLLAFARRQPLQPVAVDVARLVRGMGDLVSSTTGPQIEVVVQASAELPAAQADPNQLEMALLNLAVNARDAMPGGGTLRISATSEDVGDGHRSGLRPGTYIRLSVADTGSGMDEATIARAVEPFFSTKGVGKGTGLGLSMVHGLASQLGGALTIQSRPNLGTNIELWLRESAEAPSGPKPVEDAGVVGARGIALLVDDEELVRMSTADMLSDLGYAVIEAASGEEAMRLVEKGERFDLLLTDHLMPGISGTDLARAVRSARPDIPVLLVSGYAESEGVDADLPRLTKPFRKDELAASLVQLSLS